MDGIISDDEKHGNRFNCLPAATFTVGIDTTASSGYGLTISLGSTDTRSVKAGRYVYDVLVGSGMTVYRIVDGNILVRGGVSSAP